MKTVCIGVIGASVKAELGNKEIDVVENFENVREFIEWVIRNEIEFDNILLIPSGFEKSVDKTHQFRHLQQILLRRQINKPLVVLTSDKDFYTGVTGLKLITYDKTTIEFEEKIRLSTIVRLLKTKEDEKKEEEREEISLSSTKGEEGERVSEEETSTDEVNSKESSEEQIAEEEVAVAEEDIDIDDPEDAEEESNKEEGLNITSSRSVSKEEIQTLSDSKIVVVCSVFPGSGSSFVVNNLASMLSQENITSSVVEWVYNYPRLADMVKDKPPKWEPMFDTIYQGKEITKNNYWREPGINWFPLSNRLDSSDYAITEDVIREYIRVTRISKYVFVDISYNITDPYTEVLLNMSDVILAVFRPDKVFVGTASKRLRKFLSQWSSKVRFVGNMFDDYSRSTKVLNHLLDQLTGKKDSNGLNVWKDKEIEVLIPSYDRTLVSKSEWEGIPLMSLLESSTLSKDPFLDLMNLIGVGETLYEKRRGLTTSM